MTIRLYEPLNTLKAVDENIWIVDGGKINMSFVITKVPFSTRMTIVRLKNGDLWCHSPIKLTPSLLEEVRALGSVKHLISPNKLHYAFIKEWQEHFPEATAWASPGVDKRAQKHGATLSFDEKLSNYAPDAWKNDIQQFVFNGSFAMEEVVFFHRESRTLILTDLIENFDTEHVDHWFHRQLLKRANVAAPYGQTPIDFRLSFLGNKKKARKHLEQLLEWNPEKIILAHGDWFDSNGKEELKRAFHWLQ